MPEGYGGAGRSLLGEQHRAASARRQARPRCRAWQLAARAGEIPRLHFRRRDRRPQHPHRHSAGVRARRAHEAPQALLPGRPRRSGAPRRLGRGARESEGLKGAAFLLLASVAAAAWGASQEENLKALRGRIDAINRELQKKEEATKEARDSLRDSERAISNASRALARAATEARQVRAEAARIAERRRATEAQIAQREAALERMLVAWSAAGAPDALRVVLSGDDPADLGRKLHYLGAISRAAAALIAEQRAALAELERLVGEARLRAERL